MTNSMPQQQPSGSSQERYMMLTPPSGLKMCLSPPTGPCSDVAQPWGSGPNGANAGLHSSQQPMIARGNTGPPHPQLMQMNNFFVSPGAATPPSTATTHFAQGNSFPGVCNNNNNSFVTPPSAVTLNGPLMPQQQQQQNGNTGFSSETTPSSAVAQQQSGNTVMRGAGMAAQEEQPRQGSTLRTMWFNPFSRR